MIVRAGTGWQYLLADLSLILFMVTAAALAQTTDAPAKPVSAAGGAAVISPQAEPLAVYRVAAGAPPLGQWLRDQSADARQQLTIVAQYAPGTQVQALQQAEAMVREAGEAGTKARVVVEPGVGGVTASLAYDVPAAGMARNLQNNGQTEAIQKDQP